jgi:hypothetical protein
MLAALAMLHLLLLLLAGMVTAAPQWLDLTSRSIKWTLSNATLNVAGNVPGAVHTDLLSNATLNVAGNVPGAVHTDLVAAGVIPEPYLRFGDTDLRWVALSDAWQYSATFSVTSDVLSAVRCAVAICNRVRISLCLRHCAGCGPARGGRY